MPLDALRGVAQGVAGRALKKVTGSIKAGLLGNKKGLSDFSDFSGLNTFGSKFNTKSYRFPIDVESGKETGNHGHYMIFEINEQKKPKLSFFERQAIANEGKLNIKKAQKEQGNVPEGNIVSGGPPNERFQNNKAGYFFEHELCLMLVPKLLIVYLKKLFHQLHFLLVDNAEIMIQVE